MKFILIASIVAVLSGCATSQKYDKLLSGLIGKPEAQLLSDWGQPQESKDIGNGDRMLTYDQKRTVQTGGYTLNSTNNYNTGRISSDFRSATGGSTRTLAMPTMPTRDITMSCITRFTIHQGLIQAFSWEGEDCVSSYE